MGQVIKTFLGIVFAIIVMITGISVITVQADGTTARDFKNDVISEMENSDFNPDVINACFQTAAEKGYVMEVTVYSKAGTSQTYSSASVSGTAGAALAQIKITYNVDVLGKTISNSIKGSTR